MALKLFLGQFRREDNRPKGYCFVLGIFSFQLKPATGSLTGTNRPRAPAKSAATVGGQFMVSCFVAFHCVAWRDLHVFCSELLLKQCMAFGSWFAHHSLFHTTSFDGGINLNQLLHGGAFSAEDELLGAQYIVGFHRAAKTSSSIVLLGNLTRMLNIFNFGAFIVNFNVRVPQRMTLTNNFVLVS